MFFFPKEALSKMTQAAIYVPWVFKVWMVFFLQVKRVGSWGFNFFLKEILSAAVFYLHDDFATSLQDN